MRREDDLAVRSPRENRHDQRIRDERVIDMILGLIDDEDTFGMPEDQRQNHRAALPGGQLGDALVVRAVEKLQRDGIFYRNGSQCPEVAFAQLT